MKRFGSRSGMSLVEMVVSLGIFFVVGAAAFYALKIGTREAARSEEMLSGATEVLLGEKAIWADLRKSSLSFNNLETKDDDGRRFFDYYTDAACVGGSCSRTYTLSELAPPIVFLSTFDELAPASIYDPVGAYAVGNPPALPSVSASLDFMGLNYKASAQPSPSMELLYPKTSYSRLWNGTGETGKPKTRLLMLYSPVSVRPVCASGNVDLTVPSRSTQILFAWNPDAPNTNSTRLSPGDVLRGAHPLYNCTIDDLDTFFRSLPPVGGASAFAMIRPVEMSRYRVETATRLDGGQQVKQLVREIYDVRDNAWTAKKVVADKVCTVEFKRENVAIPAVSLKIKIQKENRQTGKLLPCDAVTKIPQAPSPLTTPACTATLVPPSC